MEKDEFGGVEIVKPVVDYSVKSLCRKPYHNHTKGCPNSYKESKKQCPPRAPKIEDVINLNKPVYCIYNIFEIGKHISKMKKKHPDWTEHQLRCCLYWQPVARKQLKERIKNFLKEHRDVINVECPEGCGVNLTVTMKNIGIELEWPPKKLAYQITLLGTPNNGTKRFKR